MLMLLLLVPFALALTSQDAYTSVLKINTQRIKYNLPKITYNFSIQRELENIPDNFWFSKSMNITESFYLGNSPRVRPYNLYFAKFKDFKYLFHDTVKTTMSSIIAHRIKQKPCFKLKKCSKDKFNYFYSCGYEQQDVQDNTRCSWGMHYYPRMIIKSLKQIACILPGIQGPNVPSQLVNVQNKVFICYGKYNDLTNDNPLNNKNFESLTSLN